ALLCKRERLDGDSIVFLRKAMRLTTESLAQLLSVDRLTVDRWENNKRDIEGFYDFKLRLEAIDRILPEEVRPGIRNVVTGNLTAAYRLETSLPLAVALPSAT